MTEADRNCLSNDIAIERAKNKLEQLVISPNAQLVDEYAALVQNEFDAIERFIYDGKIPYEDVRGHYDLLKVKYGIDPAIELDNYVSDKLNIIVEAERVLNMCPCCCGINAHIMTGRDDGNQEYLCQTCNGTGKLA